MDKLTRVSNSLRGKKLIVCSGDYYQFIESVKIKFDIGPDAEICLQDDEGAEIDEQVFPILLEQPATPNIEFIIKGEEQAELSLDYSFAPSSSLVYSENSTKHGNSLPVLSPIKAVPQSPQFTQDILYDKINRSGLIQSRLRSIHRNLKGTKPPKRVQPTSNTGPKPKFPKPSLEESSDENVDLIAQLNSTTLKDEGELKRLTLETFSHRNYLRRTSDPSILRLYRVWHLRGYEFDLE
ncbi:hypothetical protein Fcan01_15448 [Folsomia candida]|uniref:Uncharacterized protein n=1 Tax=Folsomia candida TaxID=158441 RepID=A0A226DX70_FOLCA|nr:hypothetical protein Fcan01_15448 [Folsomia candida]